MPSASPDTSSSPNEELDAALDEAFSSQSSERPQARKKPRRDDCDATATPRANAHAACSGQDPHNHPGPRAAGSTCTRPGGNSPSSGPPSASAQPAEGAGGASDAPPACNHPGYFSGLCIACGAAKPEAGASGGYEGEYCAVCGALTAEDSDVQFGARDLHGNPTCRRCEALQRGKGGRGGRKGPPLDPTTDASYIKIGYQHESLEISHEEASRMRGKHVKGLLEQKKLALVLDLDHTLLNTSWVGDLTREGLTELQDSQREQAAANPHTQDIYHLQQLNMFTKLRPGVRELLEWAASHFELYIFTMGDRTYAPAMASILDPSGQLFKGRVLSSRDKTVRNQKSLEVLMGSPEVVVILDDTVGVWDCPENVIEVSRYLYFPSAIKHFNLPPQSSLFLEGEDEALEGGQLAAAQTLLGRLHTSFFGAGDVHAQDVRRHISGLKGTVLEGCCIVFSRVFPTSLGEAAARQHHAWRKAEALGATVSMNLTPEVTHCCTSSLGTEKVLLAERRGLPVVTLEWLLDCAFHWARLDEKQYLPVEGGTAAGKTAKPVFADPEADARLAMQAAGGGSAS